MRTIDRRLEKVGMLVRQRQLEMTDAQLAARIDELLAKMGTTRQAMIDRYGSLAKFLVVLCRQPVNSCLELIAA